MQTTVKQDSSTILSMLEEMEKQLRIKRRAKALGASPATARESQNPAAKKPPATKALVKKRARRVRFEAKILMVKNSRYLKGTSINISRSGLFVKTHEKVFAENEVIRLVIRPGGSSHSYKVIARVARFESHLGRSPGYGLRFVR